jgi:hypothetical protein
MKQTSIEWLIEQIDLHYNGENELYYDDFVQQAKEMHKQEIIDALNCGYAQNFSQEYENAEQYYQETFKGGEIETFKLEALYTKEDVLKAGEIGEINHYDYKYIVSLLDEARVINKSLKQPKQ